MASKSEIKVAEQILDRFFRDAEGKTNRQIDVYFALEDMGLPRDKAEPALSFLVSRQLINTFGPDIAFLTDGGVAAMVDDVDIGTLDKVLKDFIQAPADNAPEAAAPAPSPKAGKAKSRRPAVGSLTHIDLEGQEYTLTLSFVCTIGRADDNHVRVNDQRASKHHAEIRFEGGAFVLHDLESANGTLLNGQYVVEPEVLKHDDEVVIGRTMLLYTAPERLPTPVAEEEPSDDEVAATIIPVMGGPTERPAPSEARAPAPIRVVKGTPAPVPTAPSVGADLFAEPAVDESAGLFESKPPPRRGAPADDDLFNSDPEPRTDGDLFGSSVEPATVARSDLFGGDEPSARASDDLFADPAPSSKGDDLFAASPSDEPPTEGGDDLFGHAVADDDGDDLFGTSAPPPARAPRAAPTAPSNDLFDGEATVASSSAHDSDPMEIVPLASSALIEPTPPPPLLEELEPLPTETIEPNDIDSEPDIMESTPPDESWQESTPADEAVPAILENQPVVKPKSPHTDDANTVMMTRDALFASAGEMGGPTVDDAPDAEPPRWGEDPGPPMGSHPDFASEAAAAPLHGESLPVATASLAHMELPETADIDHPFLQTLAVLRADAAAAELMDGKQLVDAIDRVLGHPFIRTALERRDSND